MPHTAAEVLLTDLRTDGDADKQNLYQASMDPALYPLKVASSVPPSSILLDRVQGGRKRILTEECSVQSCAYSPNWQSVLATIKSACTRHRTGKELGR
jgi:hypothetical protein